MANEITDHQSVVLSGPSEYLAERGEGSTPSFCRVASCAATGFCTHRLIYGMDETLNAAQLETMHAAVVRRAKGEPLQYITGSTQFRT